MLLVDASTGKPVEKIDYLKGKNLYTKSEELYQTMRNDFESTKEYKSKIDTGNNIIDLLNKLVSLASKDTGVIDKQVKKAKSLDEVKTILMGL